MAAAQSLTPPVAWQSAPCSTAAAEPSTSAQGCAPGRSLQQGAAPAAQPQQQEQQWLQAPPPASQPAPQFGVEFWKQQRRDWLRRGSAPRAPNRRPCIDIDATYEELLSTNRRFDAPIPLLEMVDFLGDCWAQNGLYD